MKVIVLGADGDAQRRIHRSLEMRSDIDLEMYPEISDRLRVGMEVNTPVVQSGVVVEYQHKVTIVMYREPRALAPITVCWMTPEAQPLHYLHELSDRAVQAVAEYLARARVVT